MKTVTAAEANQQFSRVLREASQGETFTITSRGRPVAVIGPAGVATDLRRVARAALIDRLRRQAPIGSRNWTRDELYD